MKFFDMFSGIGGFRAGLTRAGGFLCVGHCEIDKYANKSYQAIFNTEGEYFCDDARKMEPRQLPGFELLCAGFPCQPFSQAGKKRGFNDTRGTLFFEIARLVREKRPKYLLLENVPGLLTHDKGGTFNTILSTLSELRYYVEWQVLDSKDFGVPQSRKRVYAFCYLDERCAGKVFPILRKNSQALKQLKGDQPIPLITPERLNKRQNGKRYRLPNSPMFTLTQQDRHGILLNGRIRILLPSECLRLQGYDDEQISKIIAVNSDNQIYKQAGNSVTVNVVHEIGLRIIEMGKAFICS